MRTLQARAQEILREKLVSIVETCDESSKEVQSTLAQMSEAFELLMPKPEPAQRSKESPIAQEEEGLEWEDVAGDSAGGVPSHAPQHEAPRTAKAACRTSQAAA